MWTTAISQGLEIGEHFTKISSRFEAIRCSELFGRDEFLNYVREKPGRCCLPPDEDPTTLGNSLLPIGQLKKKSDRS